MIPVQQCAPDVLAALLRHQPLTPAKVTFAWRAAVGPAFDRATAVTLDGRGDLHVTASDPHWRREIERSSGLILARLDRLLGPGVVRRLVTGDSSHPAK